MVQEYVQIKSKSGNLKTGKGLSSKTLRSHILIIKQTCIEAQKSGILENNPCDFVVLPKLERYEAEFYTETQLNSLFSAIRDEEIYPLIYLTVLYGLRRSEALGLKWSCINYDLNSLTIRHTVVRHNNVFEKDTTKTSSSYRSYPLSDNVKDLLEKLKAEERKNQKLFGREYIANDYIFKWSNGKPYNPDYITNKFSKLLKKNGLRHIRFHDLRHSCASLLVANGFTIKDIQEWLGHSDIQTTANIYAHLDIKRKNELANSITKSLNN